MIEGIYVVNHKSRSEFEVYDNFDKMNASLQEGDFVYEVREVSVAKRSKINLEEIPKEKFNVKQHNYA